MKAYKICPLCKKIPEQQLFGLENYRYCRNCSLGWIKKFSELPYRDTYYRGTSSLFSLLFFPVSIIFYLIRINYVRKRNIRLWIDVGAGDGGFLKFVNAKRKIGVEISSSGRTIMEKSGLETATEREFLKESGLNADVISFWHVLEHTQNPWIYLRSAHRNLAEKGTIVIGIPNFESFEFKIFKRCWFHLDPKRHFWHFSTKSIKGIISNEGFEIKKIDFWSLEHHLTGVLQSFINKSSGSENILHRLVKRAGDSAFFSLRDAFWSIFWLTIGFPVVVGFWIIGSLFRKSGTIVVIAEKQN